MEQARTWTSELDSSLSSATDFLCDFNFLICSLEKKKGSLVSKTSFGTFFVVVVWFFVLFLCFLLS